MPYSAYCLTDASREILKGLVPFAHPTHVGHHVTHKYPDFQNPPFASSIKVVGVSQDDVAQALIVEVDGSTERPDKKTYHITWSLVGDARPVYSNTLIAEKGWEKLEKPVDIFTIPMCL